MNETASPGTFSVLWLGYRWLAGSHGNSGRQPSSITLVCYRSVPFGASFAPDPHRLLCCARQDRTIFRRLVPLGSAAQCRFPRLPATSECLGLGTVVGDEVWNQQSKIRIILGPLSLEKYLEFLPDGSNWEPLRSWVRFFLNEELDFEVQLILEREQVPACRIGSGGCLPPQLGWVSWLKSNPLGRDPDDTVLAIEAEQGVRT